MSEDNGAFYAGGYFTRAHSSERAWYAAKFSTQAGAAQDTGFDFQPSTVSAGKYQQTISSAGNRVFIGGSEHSLFGYDTGSNQRTSGSVMLSIGGDLQASTISAKGVIYGSCHCSDGAYQDKYDWGVNDNWSRIDEIKWVGAWDATTGENLHWTPFELSSKRKTGASGSAATSPFRSPTLPVPSGTAASLATTTATTSPPTPPRVYAPPIPLPRP